MNAAAIRDLSAAFKDQGDILCRGDRSKDAHDPVARTLAACAAATLKLLCVELGVDCEVGKVN